MSLKSNMKKRKIAKSNKRANRLAKAHNLEKQIKNRGEDIPDVYNPWWGFI